METLEFLKISREKISSDPNTRLTKLAKEVINSPDCIIDAHAHIFDKKCLTVSYILLRLLKSKLFESLGLELSDNNLLNKSSEEIYNEIKSNKSDNEADWNELKNELEDTIDLAEAQELFGLNLKEAFRILDKKDMLEVLDYYFENFSILQLPGFENRPFVAVILLMDLETGWGIKPDKKLFQQLIEIKKIMLKRPIIPFFPVDPNRAYLTDPNENLYELFLSAFSDTKTPFFGVKCYPALGYFPEDERLDPVFRICAEKNIPVLTHCGGETVSTFRKKIEFYNSSGKTEFQIPGDSRSERAKYLNNPELWIPVLKRYNNLKINFGHFGGDTNWENHSETGNNERIAKIINMMKNPKWKIFTDFSFNIVEKELFNAFRKELAKDKKITEKIMFGTDYWVVLPAGDLLGMQKEFLEHVIKYQATLLRSASLEFLLH